MTNEGAGGGNPAQPCRRRAIWALQAQQAREAAKAAAFDVVCDQPEPIPDPAFADPKPKRKAKR